MTPKGLAFNNPLAPATIAAALDLLDVGPESLVLDVGCGRGEALAMLLERSACRVIGVDPDADDVAAALDRLAPFGDRAELHRSRLQDLGATLERPSAALCIGSSHAFAGPGAAFETMLRELGALVTPGGRVLVGEGYWRSAPAAEYLGATGMAEHDFRSHAGNVAVGESTGLRPLAAFAASREDWDRFESAFWNAAERHLDAHPEDPAAVDRAAHWRRWRSAYLRWGRDTLGFGLYLFATAPA